MQKISKILFSVLLTFSLFSFAGCGGGETTNPDEEIVSFQTLTGTVKALGVSVYTEGTHRLEAGGQIVALLSSRSDTLDLDSLIGQEMELQGVLSETEDGTLQVLSVVLATPVGGDSEEDEFTLEAEKMLAYEDVEYTFSVDYPDTLGATETRRGVAFYDVTDSKIIEILVLENALERELGDWLETNYGYTADQLNSISLAGLAGYQFQNTTTGSVVYLADGTKIFALVWLDSDDTNRARNRRYYLEVLQSFDLLGRADSTTEISTEAATSTVRAALGQECGGIDSVRCAAGLACQIDGSTAGGTGKCVINTGLLEGEALATDVEFDASLPPLSDLELERGWYYGDFDGKKLGTPDDWILVDRGTRSAMWRKPVTSEPEAKLDAANTTAATLSLDQQKVLAYLKQNIETLAPEPAMSGDWQLVQAGFVTDETQVYATYAAGEQTRRLLLSYQTTEDLGVSVTQEAYFTPGHEKDWIVTEGNDSAFGAAQKIVDAAGSLTVELVEDYRLLENINRGFSVQYPKKWYWGNITTTETGFSDQPLSESTPRVTIEIVKADEDQVFGKVIEDRDWRVWYAVLDSKKTFKIYGKTGDDEIVEQMGKTIQNL